MLDEIVISSTDLIDVKADIIERYVREPLVWSKVVLSVKRDVYASLKSKIKGEHPDYDNTALDTYMTYIKDLPNEKNLTRLIATLTVAKILEHNDLNEEAAYYRQLAQNIPLNYYVDQDDDDVVGSTELESHRNVVFGR